jgi:hypothetical protein
VEDDFALTLELDIGALRMLVVRNEPQQYITLGSVESKPPIISSQQLRTESWSLEVGYIVDPMKRAAIEAADNVI